MNTPLPNPRITTTRPTDWKYVAEGGASIVFSYTGPGNNDFDGMVLRLRKVPLDQALSVSDEDEDDPTIAFQQTVIARLIPPANLPRLSTVILDPEWLHTLSALVDSDRPSSRREKDTIDTSRKKGVLATDLVGGKQLSIEIKPKWGFLPRATHLSPGLRDTKIRTCRFCMHTYFRGTDRDASTSLLSTYCPLDLYSGEDHRVRKALGALWDAWFESGGEVNNMRVFVWGNAVRPQDDDAAISLAQALRAGADAAGELSLAGLKDEFVLAVARTLLNSHILQRLSQLQRSLDALDIEGLSKLLQHPRSSPLTSPTLHDYSSFVDAYPDFCKWDHDHPQVDEGTVERYVIAGLLAGTLKDCSVLVCPALGCGHEEGTKSNGTITLIDMDTKSVDRLGKWESMDNEIVKYWLRAGLDKACSDTLGRSSEQF